jgi:hypothetical protein
MDYKEIGYDGRDSIEQEEDYLHWQRGLKFKEETSKGLNLEHSYVWC